MAQLLVHSGSLSNLGPKTTPTFSFAAEETGERVYGITPDPTLTWDPNDPIQTWSVNTLAQGAAWSEFAVYAADRSSAQIAYAALSQSWNPSTLGSQSTTQLEDYIRTTRGVDVSPDGTKLFILYDAGRLVHYALSTPHDPTTATVVNEGSVGIAQGVVTRLAVSSDGRRVAALNTLTDVVYLWVLSTPFDFTQVALTSSSVANRAMTFNTGTTTRISFTDDGNFLLVPSVNDLYAISVTDSSLGQVLWVGPIPSTPQPVAGVTAAEGRILYGSNANGTARGGTVPGFPDGIESIDSLQINLNLRTVSLSDDDLTISALIRDSGGAVIAASNSGGTPQTVLATSAGVTQQTFSVDFGWIKSGLTRAELASGSVVVQQSYSRNMGGDGGYAEIYYGWVSGSYTPSAPLTSGSGQGHISATASLQGQGSAVAPSFGSQGHLSATASLSGFGRVTPPKFGSQGHLAASAALAGFGSLVVPHLSGQGHISATASLSGSGSSVAPLFGSEGHLSASALLSGFGSLSVPRLGSQGHISATASLDGFGSLVVPFFSSEGHLIATAVLSGRGKAPSLNFGSQGHITASASLVGVGSLVVPVFGSEGHLIGVATLSGRGSFAGVVSAIKAFNGSTWVTPMIYDGTTWVPLKAYNGSQFV